MNSWLMTLITVVGAVAASSGFWAFIQKRSDKKDVRTKMLIGLGHDRVMTLSKEFLDRGNITTGEYENLHDYLYEPYKELGGNGSAARIMQEVERLPIVPDEYGHGRA